MSEKGSKKDWTIRAIDAELVRQLKAQAALEGRSIGAVVADAIRLYLQKKGVKDGTSQVGSKSDNADH